MRIQDGSGWTPLMIASSLRDGDDVVDLLLAKGADVSCKSQPIISSNLCIKVCLYKELVLKPGK